LQPHEYGHKKIVSAIDTATINLATAEGKKSYKFNAVINEESG